MNIVNTKRAYLITLSRKELHDLQAIVIGSQPGFTSHPIKAGDNADCITWDVAKVRSFFNHMEKV